MVSISAFDHVGIRVTDIERAQAFYEKLGFVADPDEESPRGKARGFANGHGVRVHLIYNGVPTDGGNVLMDVEPRYPGYTHAAFVVDDMDALVAWFGREGIEITEGPEISGKGRRKVCFIRDPDRNVLEFNQLLGKDSGGQHR